MSRRSGSALAEVLAAILVLEVALVGVAGIVALAARTLAEGVRIERAVAAAREAVDSLALVADRREGTRTLRDGWVRWEPGEVDASGLEPLRVSAVDSGGGRFLEFRAILPAAGGPDGVEDGR